MKSQKVSADMTYSQAKLEFAIRHYLWGQSEFEQEIQNGFPILHTFKSGRLWKLCRFLQKINEKEKSLLAKAFLKKSNPEAAKELNEILTFEEEELHLQYRDFCLAFSTREAEKIETETRAAAAGRAKFASKPKIRRAVLKQFKAAFGGECFNLASVGLDQELNFKMKLNGWVVSTSFDFEVRGRQFDYSHTIRSETIIHPHDIPAVILGMPSLTGWLGLRGWSQWEHLIDEDIQPTCDFIIKQSRNFFDVAPKLLKNLDFGMLIKD